MKKKPARRITVKSWPARIAAARKRGAFSAMDAELAAGWPTCACGRLDAAIPRFSWGAPYDGILRDLGSQFSTAVNQDSFATASKLITAITKRAAKVLKEQAK